MGEWVPSSEVESLMICVRKLLQGQSWVVIHHGVKPQAHNSFMYIAPMVGCWSSWFTVTAVPHDLIWVYDFLRWNANDAWWWAAIQGILPPQGLCNLCKPGWRAWELVSRYGPEWHKLLGWSSCFCCLCSSPCGSGSRPAFAVSGW